MATPSKRSKTSMTIDTDKLVEIAKAASNISIPWDKVAPDYFTEWMEKFSRSHGVVKELMFMAILPAVSCLLGSRSRIRPSQNSPYEESLCLFSLCISPPNAGKSQAFKHGCKIPVQHVEKTNHTSILLDKFTDAGLRQHLQSNNGLAAIIKDECYDTLKQIASEKEMGTLCRLFDGDSLLTSTGGSGATRVSTENTAVSLGGFIQVKNFMTEIYPTLAASENGLDQRFLYSVIKPKALTRKESEPYVFQLEEANLKDLNEIYDAIYCDHKEGIVYTLTAEALTTYDAFDEETCKEINEQWSNGAIVSNDGEIGKDRRQVMRLTVILYVTYTYIQRALFSNHGVVTTQITKRYVEYAICLVKDFFRRQKSTIDKILDSSLQTETADIVLKKKILEHAGPVVSLRTYRNKYNSRCRPTKESIEDAMVSLEQEGLGSFIKSGNHSAFVKQVPTELNESEQLHPYKIPISVYSNVFCKKNFDLQNKLKESLISGSSLGESIKNYFEAQKENISS